MGQAYKKQKRARRLSHVLALLRASAQFGIDLSSYDDMSVNGADRRGHKRLAAMRIHIEMEAHRQGVDSQLLYEVARRYAPIPPSPGPHPWSRFRSKHEQDHNASSDTQQQALTKATLTLLPRSRAQRRPYRPLVAGLVS